MESLLYVVFYCALHWLPHNLTEQDSLSEVISTFFKWRTMKSGLPFGGDAKLSNTMDRLYTSMPKFDSTSFRQWLDTVFDFHSPPRGKEVEYADKWSDPGQLDAFWSEFLRTHNLEHGDRVTHEMLSEYVPGDSSSSDSDSISIETDPDERDFPPRPIHDLLPHLESKDASPQPRPGSPDVVNPEVNRVHASPLELPASEAGEHSISQPLHEHSVCADNKPASSVIQSTTCAGERVPSGGPAIIDAPESVRESSLHSESGDASVQAQPNPSSGRRVSPATQPAVDANTPEPRPRKRGRSSVPNAPPRRQSKRIRKQHEREAPA